MCLIGFVAITAKAQYYVGGTLGAAYDKVKVEDKSSTSTTSFVLSPEFGYSFAKNISVGATFGLGYSDNDETELTQYEISPYIRATFAQAKSVKFFVEGALFLNHSKYSFDGGNDFSYNTYGAEVRPGFLVNVGNNIQLIGRTTFLRYAKAEKNDIDIKNFTIAIPNEFSIGILFNI